MFSVILLAAAQLGTISPNAVQAIGAKQDDPRAMCKGSISGIVVQGGIQAIGPKQDDPRKLQIGPKQDDPRAPALGTVARPGDDTDPQACEVQQR